ncbi:MAG: phosphate acetyltransferase [Spirochaetes bacterium GWF1_31_7]|nr:MAG: phosphate acetyltransferase [Spirochaetes bacterium GWE1_32_154]OHD45449.1 MAG: phosphate acetyltransferase [Spirochaetes bacterium GWE2_31_10]OHD50572.1 MAG: phosphate acetyltransferase [Spirochaetes bacterium GWF1_31_7]HBD94574.1 phosphate acetyltransferase [Spirochaetia bacterium]HBI36549.1 phosphate acetyltransferase [Spirochaetia bacterium]
MNFIKMIEEKAISLNKKIVLPETEDDRVIKAASEILKRKLAKIILIGNPETIHAKASGLGVSIDGAEIINPVTSEYYDEFVTVYQKKREKKGMTIDQAKEIMANDYMFFGAMLVEKKVAHGMVGGALNTTAHTLRAMIQCVGTKPGTKSISSFFIMISPNKEIGYKGITFFADCAVIPLPDANQLADIAEATADNFKAFVGETPMVAMLSFSTKGSAETEETKKVAQAVDILQARRPDIMVDGELQLDAAIVAEVGNKKAPGSKVAGRANVLVFPNLEAGNIGYKLVQRFGNAEALGPILQGANRPVNDLSRGCSVEDIVNVVSITSVQV